MEQPKKDREEDEEKQQRANDLVKNLTKTILGMPIGWPKKFYGQKYLEYQVWKKILNESTQGIK
jgi:hypothetical protein